MYDAPFIVIANKEGKALVTLHDVRPIGWKNMRTERRMQVQDEYRRKLHELLEQFEEVEEEKCSMNQ